MYRTLAFPDDDTTQTNHMPIFSVESIKDSHIEAFRGHKTSRRTLLVCSLILISTSGLLATWLFVAKPHFYPNLGLFGRSASEGGFEVLPLAKTDNIKKRQRRSAIKVADQKRKVEALTSAKSAPFKESRLPFDLVPTDYYLYLDVDLNSDTFSGETKIKLVCKNRTRKVIFHGRRIIVNDLTVFSEEETLQYTRISYLTPYELFVVEMETSLIPKNTYYVQIYYTASYGKSLAGFYKSHYSSGGVQRTMVSTHFEPTDARSAFPCLDEPFFKAIYHINISHSKELIALSNMPVKNQKEVGKGRVVDEFLASVRMSTYLVAFSVNDFTYQERKTPAGLTVRVYARKDDYKRISYAVKAATKIIAFYEKFFDVPYPLPKLDLLSVPDFMAGAMEDWGLVSFRSAYLIFDEDIMTVESQRQITLVIAHELAHQWFGNLVTMKWWNDIWLNEGFANFVEMHGTNTVDDQFRALDMQVPTGWQAAIALDSLYNSHPVSQHVKRNSEIDELFDAISYNKGASLLRMVQGFMRKDFIRGVKTYIDEYKFSNAETDDLWKHLTRATNNTINVKEVMETWTKQRSFPVITLARNGSGNRFTATQESFLTLSGEKSNNSATKDNSNLWQVPLSYITDENQEPATLFLKDRETLLPIDNSVSWVKLNIHSMGFYVTNYDTQTWRELTTQLRRYHLVFSDVDRAGLLHDAFKLACENLIDPVIPLNMTLYLRREFDFIPWAMVRARSECMSMMLPNKNDKLKYKKYIWALQSHLIDIDMLKYGENVPKPKLSKFQRLQRFEAFSFALKHHFGSKYREEISKIFSDMVRGKKMKNLMPEVRALALMYGYNPTNESHWNYLWQVYSMSEVDSDRKIVMRAFAQFKELNKINQILDTTLDTHKMRLQDTIPMLSNLVKFGSRKIVWDFVKKYIHTFKERYGGGYQLGQLLVDVAGGFNTKDMLKEVESFLKKHPIGAKGSRTELQVIEKIKNNINRHSDVEMNRKTIAKVKDFLEEENRKRDHVS